jgi:hypothetical protein
MKGVMIMFTQQKEKYAVVVYDRKTNRKRFGFVKTRFGMTHVFNRLKKLGMDLKEISQIQNTIKFS